MIPSPGAREVSGRGTLVAEPAGRPALPLIRGWEMATRACLTRQSYPKGKGYPCALQMSTNGRGTRGNMAAKLLNFVTGDAKLCGPCALSAVTGLPSNTWPDEAMTAEEIWGHLEKQRFEHGAPFYVEPLPVDSFAIGRVFWAFCHPALNPDERPVPNPEGRWILVVDPRDGSDEGLHSVAVGVRRWGESWRRVMADNAHREPVPLGKIKWGVYRRAIVVAGLHLVDDPNWEAQWTRIRTGAPSR